MITALGVILTIYSILSNKCCKGGGIIPHGNDHYNATNKWSDDFATEYSLYSSSNDGYLGDT